ncbi:MAG: DUF1330 domain-containing protein [Acidobacteriota bacterium]|nr:DUF1330 domain-containing protein [Acidobacteriota bacterium]MDE2921900.1 DUF1330 domain-containing protein [Acidobacteriota bacterium]MDE3265910.1 DUF1330 domain-containing protein [Acidobacteriota bacterium]
MPTFENDVYPQDSEQIAAMQEPGPEGPIYMVNLLKFKEKAEYSDGRETDLTGREAYQIYGQAVSRIIQDFGGHIVFAADVTHLSLGRVDELWDEVAIACYPNRAALVAMSTSEPWRKAGVHREAGLAGQLNIETVLMPGFEGVALAG